MSINKKIASTMKPQLLMCLKQFVRLIWSMKKW